MSPSSVPPQAPSSGRPLPSVGFPGASSPTSQVLSADSDFSSPVAHHFVSFAQRYHRFAPLRSLGDRQFPESLDHFYRGAHAASQRWRKRDLPGSWATLACMPRSQTPADRRTQATAGPAMWSSIFVTTSTPHRVLSGLYHAACTLSVYASQPGSPPDHAILDSGWWPALTGQGSHLLGRIEGFRQVYPSTWLPPSPSFAWRNTNQRIESLEQNISNGQQATEKRIDDLKEVLMNGQTATNERITTLDERNHSSQKENAKQFAETNSKIGSLLMWLCIILIPGFLTLAGLIIALADK